MKNIIILAIFIIHAFVFAQEVDIKPKIAVYITGSIKENEKKALNTEILHALVKSGRYTAIESSKEFLAAVDQEQKKQRSGAIDDKQIRALGKRFGVQFICISDVTEIFSEFQISTRIVNINAETAAVDITGIAYSELKTSNDLKEASNKLIESMFGDRAETNDKIQPTELIGSEAYNSRGIEFFRNGEFDNAIADLTEAIQLDPDTAAYYINRGIVYYHMENYHLAIEDYTDGIELDQSDAEAFDSRGDAYRKLEFYDDAINDYETALRIDPSLSRARGKLEGVKQEKLAAQPPPPTMSEFWKELYMTDNIYRSDIYREGYYQDDVDAPYFRQNHGGLAASPANSKSVSTATPTTASDDNYEKKTRFGIKAALFPGDSKNSLALKAGFLIDIPLTEKISFSPEINYVIRPEVYYFDEKNESLFGEGDRNYSDNILNIPLLLKFAPFSAIYFVTGLNLDFDIYNYNNDGNSRCTRGVCVYSEDVKRNSIDFGLAFGGGFLLGNHFLIDFRYNVGLTDLCDGCGSYPYYEFGLGWMFGGGSKPASSEPSYTTTATKTASDDNEEKKTRFGARIAWSIQNIDFKDDYENDFGFGMPFGFVLNIPISSNVSIEPGIDFHYRMFTDDWVTYEEMALSIPLVIKFATKPPPNFAFYAEGGVQLDFPLSTKMTELDGYTLDDPITVEDRNSLDFGFILGGGISFEFLSLIIDLGYRYVNNFTKVFDGGYGTLTQHQIGISFMR